MRIGFRYHRGPLQDSLDTSVYFTDYQQLGKYLRDEIMLNYAISYYGYDERCDQELWIVTADGGVHGFVFIDGTIEVVGVHNITHALRYLPFLPVPFDAVVGLVKDFMPRDE